MVLDIAKVLHNSRSWSPRDWGFDDVPKHEIGKFYLTQNPDKSVGGGMTRIRLLTIFLSYFAEIEQAAFSPGRTVPGWEPSADPALQSRLFSYGGPLHLS